MRGEAFWVQSKVGGLAIDRKPERVGLGGIRGPVLEVLGVNCCTVDALCVGRTGKVWYGMVKERKGR